MKWQKLFLFLAVSSVALGCFVMRWPLVTILDQLAGHWQRVMSIHFIHWSHLLPPQSEVGSATGSIIGAVLVIDLLYLLWFHRQRRTRTYPTVSRELSAWRHCLSAHDYEERLRQRHAALLARYQDPGLVQFLLNREAARAQRIEQWIEVEKPVERMATIATRARQNNVEVAEQWPVDGAALRMVVNPVGV